MFLDSKDPRSNAPAPGSTVTEREVPRPGLPATCRLQFEDELQPHYVQPRCRKLRKDLRMAGCCQHDMPGLAAAMLSSHAPIIAAGRRTVAPALPWCPPRRAEGARRRGLSKGLGPAGMVQHSTSEGGLKEEKKMGAH